MSLVTNLRQAHLITAIFPLQNRSAKQMAPSIKLATAVGCLTLVVVLLALGKCLQQRCRRGLKAIITARFKSVSEVATAAAAHSEQGYRQWKAELDDEESRLCEVAAKDKRHEIGADGERYELSADERWNGSWDLQELK